MHRRFGREAAPSTQGTDTGQTKVAKTPRFNIDDGTRKGEEWLELTPLAGGMYSPTIVFEGTYEGSEFKRLERQTNFSVRLTSDEGVAALSDYMFKKVDEQTRAAFARRTAAASTAPTVP